MSDDLNDSVLEELLGFCRERDQLVANGFAIQCDKICGRFEPAQDMSAFVLADDARMRKLFEICKSTYWTSITRESLLATHAEVLAAVTAFATTERNVRDLVYHQVGDFRILASKTSLPFDQLRRFASIANLSTLFGAHADGFIVCRSISPPIALCGVQFVAEDIMGNVFWVHAMLAPNHSKQWAELKAPQGVIVAIKSPVLSLTSFGWHPMLRCVRDSDFVPIHDLSSPLLLNSPWFVAPFETALEWEQRGNECMARQDFDGAAAMFTRCLELESDRVDLLSNRANALIQRGKWKAALDDADRVLAIDAHHLKCAKFRAVALTKQRRYRDASSAWLHVASLDSDGKAEWTANATKAMAAQRQTEGVFDWPALVVEIFANWYVDVGTYKSPLIHVAATTIEGREFGMFAREAIPRGTLLVVETPLVHHSRKEILFMDELLLEAEKDEFVMETLTELCRAGDVEQMPNTEPFSLGTRIRDLLARHSSWLFDGWDGLAKQETGAAAGVFVDAGRFNHSCVPNCVKASLGGVVIIQSAEDIAAGSELFVAQCRLDLMVAERNRALVNLPLFKCHCARCHREANDPTFLRIQQEVIAINYDCYGRDPRDPRKRGTVDALIIEVNANPLALASFRHALR